MKTVILAASRETNLTPLTKDFVPFSLPVINKPAIEYLYYFLSKYGVSQVYIFLNEGQAEQLKELKLEDRYSVDVTYIDEKYPRGTAGCLRSIKEELHDNHFLVVNSNQIIDFDLHAMRNFHESRDSWITIAVSPKSQGLFSQESIETCYELSLKRYNPHVYQNNGILNFFPHGIYLFDPRVLDLIPPNQSYVDIKEQLFRFIDENEKPSYAFQIMGYCKSIRTINQYFQVNRDLIQGVIPDLELRQNSSLLKRGVWVGEGTTIDPSATLIEPIVIGDGCTIDKNSVIIGPVAIGNQCEIEQDSLVRESIIWEKSTLERGSEVKYSLVGKNCRINRDKEVEKSIILKNKENFIRTGDRNLISGDPRIRTIANISEHSFRRELSQKIYKRLREFFDVVIACILLIFLSPVFLVIAAAIKLFSGDRGPVYYKQLRCGKDGKEFMMIKFRTMTNDADKTKRKLRKYANEADGPLFKIADDPRLTEVGKLLRKLSLDELPQLINVCRGEMSLIGPRPLADEEMKFASSWRDARLRVKPGITGLWQISGRSQSSFHDWIRHDIFYVKNQSFRLDCKIMFKTIWSVFKRVGAY